jgi:hypothetical protein
VPGVSLWFFELQGRCWNSAVGQNREQQRWDSQHQREMELGSNWHTILACFCMNTAHILQDNHMGVSYSGKLGIGLHSSAVLGCMMACVEAQVAIMQKLGRTWKPRHSCRSSIIIM